MPFIVYYTVDGHSCVHSDCSDDNTPEQFTAQLLEEHPQAEITKLISPDEYESFIESENDRDSKLAQVNELNNDTATQIVSSFEVEIEGEAHLFENYLHDQLNRVQSIMSLLISENVTDVGLMSSVNGEKKMRYYTKNDAQRILLASVNRLSDQLSSGRKRRDSLKRKLGL